MNDAVDIYQPSFFSDLLYFAYDLSAAWIAIIVLMLIAAGLWIGYKAMPLYRILQALKTAPAVAVSSGREGVVLVVSGQSQARTLRRFRFRFWPKAALASACVLFALWLAQEHVASYPEPAVARYLDTLMTSPWASAPGLSLHPSE